MKSTLLLNISEKRCKFFIFGTEQRGELGKTEYIKHGYYFFIIAYTENLANMIKEYQHNKQHNVLSAPL